MENICRICLQSPEKLFPLKDEFGLVYKIETVSSIQLLDNDKFPSTICGECITNVHKLFNFRNLIINSDKEIKERYAAPQDSDCIKLEIERNETQSTDSVEVYVKTELQQDPESIDDNIDISEPKFHLKVEDCVKSELQEDNESVSDNAFDNSEVMGNSSIIESDMGESKETRPMHTKKRATRIKKSYKCNVCEKEFNSCGKLYSHKLAHNTPTSRICNICGLLIRTDNINKHMLIHSEGPVECKDCGKVFKNTGSMRSHLLTHRGVTYTCKICGKVSKSKPVHTGHMKSHEDKELRRVACKLCGKKFADLRRHMFTHTGERPYKCTYCNKGFISTNGLKVHTRQHTNEKPYVCKLCPMAFPQSVSLRTHMKSKHNVKATSCTDKE